MPEPINYTVPMQNPLAAFEQSANLGMGIRQNQQTLEANRLKLEAEKAGQERLRQVGELVNRAASPGATVADVQQAMAFAMNPEQYKALESKFSQMSTDELTARSVPALQAYSALRQGKNDVAIGILDNRAKALENSGDTTGANKLRAQIEAIKSDGADAVMIEIGGLLGADAKVGAPGLEAIHKQLLEPSQITEAGAKAKSATAQVIIDEAKAKWAPKNEEANYRDLLAGIGLKGAQTASAQASAAASNASAAESRASAGRANAEAASLTAGVIPAAKRPEAETALRKEYNTQTAPFKEVQSSYRRVKAAEPTGAGDVALVYGYMKMLDPGSVVREGEFATAEKTAGIPSAVVNAYNKAISGKRLTDDQRKIFLRQAGGLYNAALEGETSVRNGITRIAKKGGLDTGQIFYEGAPQRVATEAPPQQKPPVKPQGQAASGGKVDTSNPLLR